MIQAAMRLGRRTLPVWLLALCVVSPGSAGAQTAPPRPDLRPAIVTIAGKRVPLPPGQWQLLAEIDHPIAARPARAVAGTPAPATAATARTVVMGWQIGGRMLAMAVVRANLAPAATGFGIDADCRRRDLHVARLETPADSPLAICGMVAPVLHGLPATNADPGWQAALARMDADRVTAPPLWLMVAFRLADDDDVLDVRYFLDPQLLQIRHPADMPAPAPPGTISRWFDWARGELGYPPNRQPAASLWRRSGWGAEAIGQDSARVWVIGQIAAWYDDVRGEIRQGFKGRGGEIGWPAPWQVAFGLSAVAPPPLSAAIPGAGLVETQALWKTISWRTIGSLLDAIVAYLVTGNTAAAGTITVVGGFVNSIGYYVHELAWGSINAAGTAGQSVTELGEVGIVR